MTQTATAAEIVKILGPVDQVLIADIRRAGATAAEVLEAFTRLEGDDAVGRVARRSTTARVAEVMGILQAAEIGPERD